MELFPPIPDSLGITVLFHIFRMGLSVMFEISGVLIKPLFEPGVIIAEIVRITSSPACIVFRLMGFFAVRIIASYLMVAYPWVGGKQFLTITAPLPFHPGPLSTG
jgi:hypothetical protein